jgi:E3 ubiquitin-protein ligase RNF14
MAAAIAHGLGRDNGYIGEEAVAENREQQAIEVETLRSIYGDEVTVITEGTEYLVKVTPNLDADVQVVFSPHNAPSTSHTPPHSLPEATSTTPHSLSEDTPQAMAARLPRLSTITHLPPLTLFVRYLPSYPSHTTPILHLSARWLDNRVAGFAVERMHQMFTPECPVIFDCINYLQNEFIAEYIKQQTQGQDTTASGTSKTFQSSSTNPSNSANSKQSVANEQSFPESSATKFNATVSKASTHSQAPPDQHAGQIFLRSISQFNDVEEYDRYECHREFLQSKHECTICFLLVDGERLSEPCLACGGAFCKQCLVTYCQTLIGDGRVSGLDCPTVSCSQPLSLPLLEALLSPDLLKRYLRLQEEVELDSIPGMVFCPRPMCRSRVVSEPDSDLAMCTECGFPFCKICKQTWHGPGVCPSLSM